MLDKSDDMLGEEIAKALTENLQRLQSRFDNLQSHHNTLLSDHEKLSYEFLQRKQDLEKLRVSYEDLQKERDLLLAQQISATQEEFVPPCLKCMNMKLLILHLNVQMLQLLQILHLPLLSLIPHLRTLLVSLTMQG